MPSTASHDVVRDLVDALDLAPLPHEGGYFRRAHLDEHCSAIYYLLAGGDCSAMHRLCGTEVYHFYAGSPLQLLLLHPDGAVTEPVVGPDIAAGQRPQIVVGPGTWQGSSSAGDWSLIGTTMAPPFDWEGFTLGDRDELVRQYPAAADRIDRLTR